MSAMPITFGSPICTGAPWTRGIDAVTVTARTTLSGGSGRIETTMFPWNFPAGRQGMFVLYIGTFRFSSIWRTGTPASSSAASNEKLQPIRKLTRSSRQKRETSVYSPVRTPFS